MAWLAGRWRVLGSLPCGGELALAPGRPGPPIPAVRRTPRHRRAGRASISPSTRSSCSLLVFWLWVKSADWVSRDSLELGDAIGMPAKIWNPIMVFSFLLVFISSAWRFRSSSPALRWSLLAYAVPFVIYVVQRNGKVTQDKKVFTPRAHQELVCQPRQAAARSEVEVKHAWQLGPPVEIVAVGPLQMENQAALIEARQSPAYVPVKFLLADALAQRADKIMLDYTADAVAVRYQIDGMWHNATPKVHETGPAQAARPQAGRHDAGRDEAAVPPQHARTAAPARKGRCGSISAATSSTPRSSAQGTQTGERAVLSFTLSPSTSARSKSWACATSSASSWPS